MDFKAVLSLIIKRFSKEQVRYALMGGFALGALGVPRATIDLDFLVLRDDLPKIDSIMKENGYGCVYKSKNVSQYVSAVKIFGEIDFLLAFRDISVKMLESALEKDIFAGELKIRVLRPEDIIGLKVQALVNDEARAAKEYLDIEALMEYYGSNLDWMSIKEYFEIFDKVGKFNELKKRFCDVKR